MLEYYFSEGFDILECIFNDLAKLPNEINQRIHAGETYNSYSVVTCINTIPSTLNTLKNLLLNKKLHSYYIQTEFNEKE